MLSCLTFLATLITFNSALIDVLPLPLFQLILLPVVWVVQVSPFLTMQRSFPGVSLGCTGSTGKRTFRILWITLQQVLRALPQDSTVKSQNTEGNSKECHTFAPYLTKNIFLRVSLYLW